MAGTDTATSAAMAGAAPIIAIEGLTKRRERNGVAFELEVEHMHLEPGRFVAVLGESGCGKSTLLDLIALVLKPTRCERFELSLPASADGATGAVNVRDLWHADDENALSAHRCTSLGYVLQTGGLFPFLSVRDNILLPAQLNGRTVSDQDLLDLARRIGLAEHLGKKPMHLSGGQRQRAAVLRAIVHAPPLIVADEPTAAVDKARAKEIVADLHALARQQGATIIMVTHDPGLVADLADAAFGFEVEKVGETDTRSRLVPRS